MALRGVIFLLWNKFEETTKKIFLLLKFVSLNQVSSMFWKYSEYFFIEIFTKTKKDYHQETIKPAFKSFKFAFADALFDISSNSLEVW